MKVRVLTAMPPAYPSGAVVDVADALAHAWIGSGRAEAVLESSAGAPAAAARDEQKRGKKGARHEAERATAEPADNPAAETRR